jgi:hypothetical protein
VACGDARAISMSDATSAIALPSVVSDSQMIRFWKTDGYRNRGDRLRVARSARRRGREILDTNGRQVFTPLVSGISRPLLRPPKAADAKTRVAVRRFWIRVIRVIRG